MNREIKFRGRRVDNKGWVYGLLHYQYETGIWQITCSNGWAPTYYNPDEGETTVFADVDYKTVGQFTGLLDKNGKEIFEGDIVTCWFPGMPNNERARQVTMFIDGCFGCGNYPLKIIDMSTVEVMGNIYDNPELLKEATNG
jgi:uncharacterized phage protein (TIGR01671 family)